ncbi:MAG TPA: hypothetical protein VF202_05895 [Trueperaceae bacterium]
MARTYRAAYWTDGQGGELVLTAPEHSTLSEEALLAEARAEAERAGVDLSYGRIEIGDWHDPDMQDDQPRTLRGVLARLPGTMHLSDGGTTWTVDNLLDALDEDEDAEYVLGALSDGRATIERLDANGYRMSPPAYVEERV